MGVGETWVNQFDGNYRQVNKLRHSRRPSANGCPRVASCCLVKIPLARRRTPSRLFFESPCRNFFQPTLNKEEIARAGWWGSESQNS